MKKYLFIVLLVGVCFGQNRSALVDATVDAVIDRKVKVLNDISLKIFGDQGKLINAMEIVEGNINSNEFNIVSNVHNTVDRLRNRLNSITELITIKNATRSNLYQCDNAAFLSFIDDIVLGKISNFKSDLDFGLKSIEIAYQSSKDIQLVKLINEVKDNLKEIYKILD